MKTRLLIIIGIVAILAGSLGVLVISQQTEIECLRLYKDIRELAGTPEMSLAEREAIDMHKSLVFEYVEKSCPDFLDLGLIYNHYNQDTAESIPQLVNNFILTVSNQSFDIDPVDIVVMIDNKTVIDKEFLVKFQHNYQTFEFDLTPGTHTLYAESLEGKYTLKEEFTIVKELWASLDFEYYEDDETLPKLRLIISETELGFL